MHGDPRYPPKPVERQLQRKTSWEKIKQNLGIIIVELVTTIGLVLVLLVLHKTIEWAFGPDLKFLGKVPVRYVFDIGDIILVGKFLWRSAREFNDN